VEIVVTRNGVLRRHRRLGDGRGGAVVAAKPPAAQRFDKRARHYEVALAEFPKITTG